jgi:hypothetical protein
MHSLEEHSMIDKRLSQARWAALVGIGLLAFASPALAEGETPAANSVGTPAGVGILILLLGLAAIGLIGATIVGRMMPASAGMVDDDALIEDELQ